MVNDASDRRQSKTLFLSTNMDPISLETELSTAVCRRLATNGNRKHCFQRFVIRGNRLFRAFLIAACPI